MEHICFSYHMKNDKETAETCITLPMEDKVAESILSLGDDSLYMDSATGVIHGIFERLSEIQGYQFCGVVQAKKTHP